MLLKPKLLVEGDIAALERRAKRLARQEGWQLLSANRLLVEAAAQGRVLRTGRDVEELLIERISAPGPTILLTDISLLFDPCWQLDPLRVFRTLARYRPIVVAWPGEWDGNTLSYAVPEHEHYRTWRAPNVIVL